MIQQMKNAFILETKDTAYCFRVMESGQLEHLYYGKKLHITERALDAMGEKHAVAQGNTNIYNGEHPHFSLEDQRLEVSAFGKGDIREPFLEIVHADGSFTSDFVFEEAQIRKGKFQGTLPGAYDETESAEHLCITMTDRQYHLRLQLYYWVFADCNVIVRSARLYNDSRDAVDIRRLMSCQLDFADSDFVMTTFTGAWTREMRRTDMPVRCGRLVNASYTGTSSNRANPFVMFARRHTTEDHGECYGMNLIYSGNHYEAAEVSSFGKLRFVSGINPQSFSWKLDPGEAFETPEAVLSYSSYGFNGLSQNMHRFVRQHIVRGYWKHRVRPVLLNSWEAAYFDITEEKLTALARLGKQIGIELLVMDDGWFGQRDDDSRSLGDWYADLRKLPQGLEGICRKVNEEGLAFGIWIEPEMVNVDSDLFRAHPDWTLEIPGSPHSEGRNQRILDLTRHEVQLYIIEMVTQILSAANIAYVKWDMNRTFSDVYSRCLPPERQGEVFHRYILGLYRCLEELTGRFPHVLFEGCAAGGNRFDLGMLCFFPQIWCSDNSDALCRAEIQHNYSYGYPMSVLSAHVSDCPNHQTLRSIPMDTRFQVAAFGVLGYECDLCAMPEDELEAIRDQIALYKKWRTVLQQGCFYRGRHFGDIPDGENSTLSHAKGNEVEWICVSPDQSAAVGLLMQKLIAPNTQFQKYTARGLDPQRIYSFTNRQQAVFMKQFGSLAKRLLPAEIRNDPELCARTIRTTKLPGEMEEYQVYGDVLMENGIFLKQGFSVNGFNEQVRLFLDFDSRMYFMKEACENDML